MELRAARADPLELAAYVLAGRLRHQHEHGPHPEPAGEQRRGQAMVGAHRPAGEDRPLAPATGVGEQPLELSRLVAAEGAVGAVVLDPDRRLTAVVTQAGQLAHRRRPLAEPARAPGRARAAWRRQPSRGRRAAPAPEAQMQLAARTRPRAEAGALGAPRPGSRRAAGTADSAPSRRWCARAGRRFSASKRSDRAMQITWAISRMSSSTRPRVVSAGVPIRRPDGFIGGRSSNGIALRFTVIPTVLQAALRRLAVEPGRPQVDEHQVHVRAAGQHRHPAGDQLVGERPGVGDRLPLAGTEGL